MKQYLSVAQVAAQTGRDPKTIRRWISAGIIPAQKRGRGWLIPETWDEQPSRDPWLPSGRGRKRRAA